jgi:hypothetical protein
MTSQIGSTPLFVVACPGCRGWCAAAVSLAGQAAVCPQCAAAFVVPHPAAIPAPIPSPTPAPTPAPTLLEQAAADAPAPSSAATEPLPTFELPDTLLVPGAAPPDLQFREPVKVVGQGPNAIELRRLTPEEKGARRRRRSFIMLLTGAAILIAIAVGLGTGRRRR